MWWGSHFSLEKQELQCFSAQLRAGAGTGNTQEKNIPLVTAAAAQHENTEPRKQQIALIALDKKIICKVEWQNLWSTWTEPYQTWYHIFLSNQDLLWGLILFLMVIALLLFFPEFLATGDDKRGLMTDFNVM